MKRVDARLAAEPATAGELSELKFEETRKVRMAKGYDRSKTNIRLGFIPVAGVVLARKELRHRHFSASARFARGLYARHLQRILKLVRASSALHRITDRSVEQGRVLRPSRPE